jgi:hypothetical protein
MFEKVVDSIRELPGKAEEARVAAEEARETLVHERAVNAKCQEQRQKGVHQEDLYQDDVQQEGLHQDDVRQKDENSVANVARFDAQESGLDVLQTLYTSVLN